MVQEVIGLYCFYTHETADGRCCNATGLQLPGVLDELFTYTGPLGAVFSEEAISLYLWAPTAQVCQFLKCLLRLLCK